MQRRASTRPLNPDAIRLSAFEYYGRLGRVKRFIDQHYAEDLPLRTAARVACLEEKYFSSFFHRKTGVRYIDFVAFVRVERAKALLETCDLPIAEVAKSVGFHNRRTFERAFKKWTGGTPSRFRAGARPESAPATAGKRKPSQT